MESKAIEPFDAKAFLAKMGQGRTITTYPKNRIIFSQGDLADAVLFVQKGKVRLTVISKHGKEAVIAILGANDFFGEASLAGQPLRMATATAVTVCSILRIEKQTMVRMLQDESKLSEVFMAYLLSRTIRGEEDLLDHLFNSSEKRLARVLLLLANCGKEGKPEPIIPKISQETLAEMIGTTRSRVNFFMNRFRKLGFVEYSDGLYVRSSLRKVVLRD
jgi:CRP/FNR family cyclic AMP-dependent transcriptional regulator